MYLRDARNRLAALKRLGITDPDKIPTDGKPFTLIEDVDPTTFVLSKNVRRRHLTSEQKRDAIAAFLKAAPEVSNRTVAKELGVSDKTVGAERKELEGRAEIPHVEKRNDSVGRKQPADKPKPDVPKPIEADPPRPTSFDRLLAKLTALKKEAENIVVLVPLVKEGDQEARAIVAAALKDIRNHIDAAMEIARTASVDDELSAMLEDEGES
jgi:DNA-binding transcriptional MocR family regulator